MKTFIALATLLTLASAHDLHGRHARLAKRQAATTTSSVIAASGSSTFSTSHVTSTSVVTVSGASTVTATSTASTTSAAVTTFSTLPATFIPPLSDITSGAVSQSTMSITTSFAGGASPSISGAPALPSFVFTSGVYPTMDKTPDTTSSQVQEWMKELDGFDIPDLNVTDGTCAGSPEAAADAAARGWWTCGGYTRSTDIVSCPDKLTWGMSFDDGPGPYSTKLLDFLNEKDLRATFFVVGSRVIERPDVLREEYMSGHEISVHTWSHPDLTSLTNAQIVAELGWTRKAIQDVLGITPVTMRPPYGDIDDRVRAIALAMGMVPIIWTRGPDNNQFDTNDWKVPGGVVTGEQSVQMFEYILGNATEIDTGFIVLEHDLFMQTVDLAVGYTLDLALNYTPAMKLEPIGVCQGWPATDLYLETTTNTTFPYFNSTIDGVSTTGSARLAAASAAAATSKSGKASGASGSSSGARLGLSIPAFGPLLAAVSVLVGGLLMV